MEGKTPSVEFFSIPVFAYRLMMLAWALWLAISLTKWVRWAWTCVSAGGSYWRPLSVGTLIPRKINAADAAGSAEEPGA